VSISAFNWRSSNGCYWCDSHRSPPPVLTTAIREIKVNDSVGIGRREIARISGGVTGTGSRPGNSVAPPSAHPQISAAENRRDPYFIWLWRTYFGPVGEGVAVSAETRKKFAAIYGAGSPQPSSMPFSIFFKICIFALPPHPWWVSICKLKGFLGCDRWGRWGGAGGGSITG
jgi:hypothetical protein